MPCEGLRDPVQGYAVKVDSSGNMRVSVQGTVSANVGGTVDVSTMPAISGTVETKPVAWGVGGSRGASVTGSATKIADSLADRVYIRISNNGASNVFIYPDNSVTTADILVAPGQSVEFHGGYDGEWYGITGGSTVAVAVVEFSG